MGFFFKVLNNFWFREDEVEYFLKYPSNKKSPNDIYTTGEKNPFNFFLV